MVTKKELKAKGYIFTKVGKDEYLDLSKPIKNKEKLTLMDFYNVIEMRNKHMEESQQRGKTISILLPLVSQENITELLSELYDRRNEGETMESICRNTGSILEEIKTLNQLNLLTESKCRPKKKEQKKQSNPKSKKKK